MKADRGLAQTSFSDLCDFPQGRVSAPGGVSQEHVAARDRPDRSGRQPAPLQCLRAQIKILPHYHILPNPLYSSHLPVLGHYETDRILVA